MSRTVNVSPVLVWYDTDALDVIEGDQIMYYTEYIHDKEEYVTSGEAMEEFDSVVKRLKPNVTGTNVDAIHFGYADFLERYVIPESKVKDTFHIEELEQYKRTMIIMSLKRIEFETEMEE
jgi:hypothetical protein